MVKCEASQDLPRGLDIDWLTYESTSAFPDIVEALKAIFNSTPTIL